MRAVLNTAAHAWIAGWMALVFLTGAAANALALRDNTDTATTEALACPPSAHDQARLNEFYMRENISAEMVAEVESYSTEQIPSFGPYRTGNRYSNCIAVAASKICSAHHANFCASRHERKAW